MGDPFSVCRLLVLGRITSIQATRQKQVNYSSISNVRTVRNQWAWLGQIADRSHCCVHRPRLRGSTGACPLLLPSGLLRTSQSGFHHHCLCFGGMSWPGRVAGSLGALWHLPSPRLLVSWPLLPHERAHPPAGNRHGVKIAATLLRDPQGRPNKFAEPVQRWEEASRFTRRLWPFAGLGTLPRQGLWILKHVCCDWCSACGAPHVLELSD